MSIQAVHHNDRYKSDFRELQEEAGALSDIPADELQLIGERLRAAHVVEKHGRVDAAILRDYSISMTIIREMCGEVEDSAPKRNRRQRWKAVERWCGDYVGTTITPAMIAEVGEFSENAARTFMKDRPDLFTKVKRGFYLVRDPKAERSQAS